MFSKKREIIDKLNNIEEQYKKLEQYSSTCNTGMNALIQMVRTLLDENKKLTEDIQTLLQINQGNLGEAANCELLVLKSYRHSPIIYKDGQLLSNDKAKSIYIHYDVGEAISVEIDT